MQYQEYDEILLRDGRSGTIVGGGGDGDDADFVVDIGRTPETWDTIFIKGADIERLINRLEK